MTKCTSCGKEHGMVLEDMVTGEKTPIDWCNECFFSKGYTYKEPDPIDMEDDLFLGLRQRMQAMNDQIMGDMSR